MGSYTPPSLTVIIVSLVLTITMFKNIGFRADPKPALSCELCQRKMGDSAAMGTLPALKAFVRTVAGGTWLRVLAAAEIDRCGLVCLNYSWRKPVPL